MEATRTTTDLEAQAQRAADVNADVNAAAAAAADSGAASHQPLTRSSGSSSSKSTPLVPPSPAVVVDHFEEMNLRQFLHYSRYHKEVLRQSSLAVGGGGGKHESWKGSADHSSGEWTCMFMVLILLMLLAVAVGVVVVVGLLIQRTTDVRWGIGAGAITFGLASLSCFVGLLMYIVCYGNGLHSPPMPCFVEKCGFVCNMKANILCRSIMTCCYNGKADCVGCIMQGEADSVLKKIQQINPPPGGVCWLGDSEFAFWHHLEEDMKEFHSNHINAGFGGSRIIDIQRNVQRLCLNWNPSTVIVHASGNDYDFAEGITAGEITAELVELLETIATARQPTITRIGYLLTSRRPVYDDAKWDFMVRVHTLAIHAIFDSPALRGTVKILDLRDNVWPLDHFVAVDRVHLNDRGHAQKSKVLLQKMLAVWPKEKVAAAAAAAATTEDENS